VETPGTIGKEDTVPRAGVIFQKAVSGRNAPTTLRRGLCRMMTPDALVLGDMFQFAAGPHNPPLIRTVRDVGADRVDFWPARWDGPLPRGTWSVSMEKREFPEI
jgi:hypothetical protein